MGVIGRLDDQVNEIIIRPVGERHKAEDREAPRAVSPEPAPGPAPPAEEDKRQDEGRADSSGLPVWLL